MIDDTDREILAILQADARISNAEIARRIGLTPSATLERVRKLEERGIVKDYHARLSPAALGLPLLAFVFVRAEEPVGCTTTGDALAAIPAVQEVHHVAGEDCFLVKVRAAHPEALGQLLREFGAIPTVRSTRTTVVLETMHESTHLPIAMPQAAAVEA